ncbi:hypothetical protein MTR_8g102830 [Medicago truncatula]|uniref:Uncharacterized protein n=1 Tax=Medicago truncatula TaxID=3880 RepID=G7L851_MEDTR|nr:hypothetical protein MTR_8g102830 [Medicago truncatula]
MLSTNCACPRNPKILLPNSPRVPSTIKVKQCSDDLCLSYPIWIFDTTMNYVSFHVVFGFSNCCIWISKFYEVVIRLSYDPVVLFKTFRGTVQKLCKVDYQPRRLQDKTSPRRLQDKTSPAAPVRLTTAL